MTRNFGNDGSPFSVTKLRTLDNAHDNEGVVSGCAGSTGTNSFDTDVASGTVNINGSRVSVSSATVSHSTSGSEDRIDLVTVDSSDTKNVVEGSQASTSGQPNAPDIPADEVVLYLVEVRGGSSEILSGDIYNEYKTIIQSSSVQVLEEASTFTESDVSIDSTRTAVNNGSIILPDSAIVDDFEDGEAITPSNVDWNDWTGSTGQWTATQDHAFDGSYSGGLTADNSKETISTTRTSGISNTPMYAPVYPEAKSGNSGDSWEFNFYDGSNLVMGIRWDGDDTVHAVDGAGYTEFSTVALNMDVWWVLIFYNIDFSTDTYDAGFDTDKDTNTFTRNTTGLSFRNSSSSIDKFEFVNDKSSSGNKTESYIDSLEFGTTRTSGDALVSWDTGVPADIKSWDLATFQRTLDNETVTIDVEDSSNNVLFSDIGQNFDISTVSTSKDVQLRANLSRSDTSNNPTCDYLARRITR